MDKVTVFAGLDYADAFVQVCVMDSTGQTLGNRRCENDWQAIARYAEQFVGPSAADGSRRRVRAAIEACDVAADTADELLQGMGRTRLVRPKICSVMR